MSTLINNIATGFGFTQLVPPGADSASKASSDNTSTERSQGSKAVDFFTDVLGAGFTIFGGPVGAAIGAGIQGFDKIYDAVEAAAATLRNGAYGS